MGEQDQDVDGALRGGQQQSVQRGRPGVAAREGAGRRQELGVQHAPGLLQTPGRGKAPEHVDN